MFGVDTHPPVYFLYEIWNGFNIGERFVFKKVQTDVMYDLAANYRYKNDQFRIEIDVFSPATECKVGTYYFDPNEDLLNLFSFLRQKLFIPEATKVHVARDRQQISERSGRGNAVIADFIPFSMVSRPSRPFLRKRPAAR